MSAPRSRLLELLMKQRPLTVWGEGLTSLITSQHNLRTKIEGRETGANKNAVRTTTLALIIEITELSQKLGWKPWRRDPEPNFADILDEFADVTAYYGTLAGIVMSRTGCTIRDLENAYMVKHSQNWDRFAGRVKGYVPQTPQSESQTLFRSKEVCPLCDGKKTLDGYQCSTCDGAGYVSRQ